MRGASNPDGRTAAPGLLPATRARGRNDGQGIGSLVSACRLISNFRHAVVSDPTSCLRRVEVSIEESSHAFDGQGTWDPDCTIRGG
jgi:hypothetical protein